MQPTDGNVNVCSFMCSCRLVDFNLAEELRIQDYQWSNNLSPNFGSNQRPCYLIISLYCSSILQQVI